MKTPENIAEMAEANHIWLNAFDCVRPTDQFKIALADTILNKLNDKENLISDEISDMLYLSINKS